MSDPTRLAERIRAEYRAVPGLTITRAQACRLWSASDEDCQAALDALIAERLLWLAPSGKYVALPSPGGDTLQADLSMTRCPHCQKRNTFHREQTISGRAVTIRLRCAGCQRFFSFFTIPA
jgi:hypothetical protein